MAEIIRNTSMKNALKHQDEISAIIRRISELEAKGIYVPPGVKKLVESGRTMGQVQVQSGYPKDRNMI